MAKERIGCSFCGRNTFNRVVKLIDHGEGHSIYICNLCVEALHASLADQQKPTHDFLDLEFLPNPKDIKEYLDNYIIGQDDAKRVIAVAVYNHYKRIKYANKVRRQSVDLDKSNIMVIGPSGTGKTLLAQTLARQLKVPIAIVDATSLTEAGYVGEDVENILLKLYHAADADISRAERGIIYIDEIDKISRKGENVSITRDVSGEGVQQALLKIIEGTVADVPPQGGRKHPNQQMLRINTKNILFICGGAFVGLDSIIRTRVASGTMGFNASANRKEDPLSHLHSQDLIRFGLIPEFIGRFPVTVTLSDLTKTDLMRIATEPLNSVIRQYHAMLKLDNTQLVVKDDALDAIATEVLKYNTGARGLRAIFEKIMINAMFEIPNYPGNKKLIITKESVYTHTPVIKTQKIA